MIFPELKSVEVHLIGDAPSESRSNVRKEMKSVRYSDNLESKFQVITTKHSNKSEGNKKNSKESKVFFNGLEDCPPFRDVIKSSGLAQYNNIQEWAQIQLRALNYGVLYDSHAKFIVLYANQKDFETLYTADYFIPKTAIAYNLQDILSAFSQQPVFALFIREGRRSLYPQVGSVGHVTSALHYLEGKNESPALGFDCDLLSTAMPWQELDKVYKNGEVLSLHEGRRIISFIKEALRKNLADDVISFKGCVATPKKELKQCSQEDKRNVAAQEIPNDWLLLAEEGVGVDIMAGKDISNESGSRQKVAGRKLCYIPMNNNPNNNANEMKDDQRMPSDKTGLVKPSYKVGCEMQLKSTAAEDPVSVSDRDHHNGSIKHTQNGVLGINQREKQILRTYPGHSGLINHDCTSQRTFSLSDCHSHIGCKIVDCSLTKDTDGQEWAKMQLNALSISILNEDKAKFFILQATQVNFERLYKFGNFIVTASVAHDLQSKLSTFDKHPIFLIFTRSGRRSLRPQVGSIGLLTSVKYVAESEDGGNLFKLNCALISTAVPWQELSRVYENGELLSLDEGREIISFVKEAVRRRLADDISTSKGYVATHNKKASTPLRMGNRGNFDQGTYCPTQENVNKSKSKATTSLNNPTDWLSLAEQDTGVDVLNGKEKMTSFDVVNASKGDVSRTDSGLIEDMEQSANENEMKDSDALSYVMTEEVKKNMGGDLKGIESENQFQSSLEYTLLSRCKSSTSIPLYESHIDAVAGRPRSKSLERLYYEIKPSMLEETDYVNLDKTTGEDTQALRAKASDTGSSLRLIHKRSSSLVNTEPQVINSFSNSYRFKTNSRDSQHNAHWQEVNDKVVKQKREEGPTFMKTELQPECNSLNSVVKTSYCSDDEEKWSTEMVHCIERSVFRKTQ